MGTVPLRQDMTNQTNSNAVNAMTMMDPHLMNMGGQMPLCVGPGQNFGQCIDQPVPSVNPPGTSIYNEYKTNL